MRLSELSHGPKRDLKGKGSPTSSPGRGTGRGPRQNSERGLTSDALVQREPESFFPELVTQSQFGVGNTRTSEFRCSPVGANAVCFQLRNLHADPELRPGLGLGPPTVRVRSLSA